MVSIRALVLSDTHIDAFPNVANFPPVDVVLHCGDLTKIGGLGNYKRAIADLKAIKAELKLVIPGNHDVSLDPKWWAKSLRVDEDEPNNSDDPDEPKKALAMWKAAEADAIHLLDEGLHRFTLKDGRSFTIYASPYTPAFCNWAFDYRYPEDRFNPTTEQGAATNAPNPIPDNTKIGIVMTHGPPHIVDPSYMLDCNGQGGHCGCDRLWRAIQRARPRLHCFGHLHEGHGCQTVTWKADGSTRLEDVHVDSWDLDFAQGNSKPICAKDVNGSDKTWLLNAAIKNDGDGPDNWPWIVDLELKS
jgi:Icc-related predicted phosphoesterase